MSLKPSNNNLQADICPRFGFEAASYSWVPWSFLRLWLCFVENSIRRFCRQSWVVYWNYHLVLRPQFLPEKLLVRLIVGCCCRWSGWGIFRRQKWANRSMPSGLLYGPARWGWGSCCGDVFPRDRPFVRKQTKQWLLVILASVYSDRSFA